MARRLVQLLTALIYNINIKGFFAGGIYKGRLKSVCVPGLNCYSCPGAVGSCPVGALQSSVGAVRNGISFYVIGFLILTGSIFGRFICGWACPFGFLQELLHKIPSPKLRKKRAFGVLKYIKYVVLAVFVLLLPAYFFIRDGVTVPAFCKYICPAGTLEAGVPLVLLNESLYQSIGRLFSWKLLVLAAAIVLSVFIYRPFCRFVCPLGAVYALFNRVSVFGIKSEEDKCTLCGACARACKSDIDPSVNPNSGECIRCGDCVRVCPTGAIRLGAMYFNKPGDSPKRRDAR
ncbi:MAG: 4Fe-4S binding protein [Clostridiales bacterium]|nr:4Fe-4S binding protein [Clostridiales bacterium]